MKYEHEVEIGRPPEAVYDYLADPANLPEWQSEVSEVRTESDIRFSEIRTFMGRRVESTIDVIVAERGREFSIRTSAGPVSFSVRHLLEPADGGRTRLRVVGEAEQTPSRLFKLGGRLLSRAAEKRFAADFSRLKEILEARA